MAAKNGDASKADHSKTLELQTETLIGDVRDAVLAEFKHLPNTWQKMNEEEQQRLITRASDIADSMVRKAVDMIAARGMPALPIEVGKITIEGAECKGAFECYADDEALLRIRHLQGSRAMFVLASPDAYNGKTETPKPDVVGDLAMPKTGPGAEHDAGALAAIGRGNGADLDVRTAAGGALKRN
jgi:hypothetical protein